jgi:hypothetical protein
VTYGKKITDQVLNTLKYVLYFVFGLMILLGVAAVVLIQNTIRLSIFSRRREIEVMKLVGATNAFVRLPFMLEGMLTGLLGAVGAVVMLAVVYVAVDNFNRAPPRTVVGDVLLVVGGQKLRLDESGLQPDRRHHPLVGWRNVGHGDRSSKRARLVSQGAYGGLQRSHLVVVVWCSEAAQQRLPDLRRRPGATIR